MALTALEIKKAGDGRLYDSNGLELHKKGDKGKWNYRYSFNGKRRNMGLGSYPTVSLAEARKERDKWALIKNQGNDPIDVRNAKRDALKAEAAKRDPSLIELTQEAFDTIRSDLRQGGKSGRWMSPLELHVLPKIGKTPVSLIQSEDVRSTLASIWKTKHPTAEKAIQRLRKVFRTGELRGYDCDPRTIDVAQELLGHWHHKTNPTPATHWRDIPELYRWLEGKGVAASCLQFKILTVVRTHGCRAARFDEIDADIWTVPEDRVKGRVKTVQAFRVPLAPEAQAIIERRRLTGSEYLFPGYHGTPITDSTMSKFLRDHGVEGRPHGFRTSFRTWAQDNRIGDWEVLEKVLDHTVGNKTERAYARSDLLELRREIMELWARFVTGKTGSDRK